MVDVKISALPATAAVVDTSLFPISNVATEKATGVQVHTYIQGKVEASGVFATNALAVHLAGAETITGVKTHSVDPLVPDSVYGAGWNGSFAVPTKNAVYDQIETLIASIATKAIDTTVVHNTGAETVAGVKTFTSNPIIPDAVYGVGWNATLEPPTKNAVYDQLEIMLASIALRAVDTAVVHNTGAETVAGVKTFTSNPIIPDEVYGATWDAALVPPTKNAVYDKIEAVIATITPKATDTLVVHLAGAETISGVKTFSANPLLVDAVYAAGWNASLEPPTKNAVYDQIEIVTASVNLKATDTLVVHLAGAESITGIKTFTSNPLIPDEIYGVGWNGSLEPPTKNAVYDKIETLSAGSGLTQQQVLVLDSMRGF